MSTIVTVSGNSGKSVFSYYFVMALTKRKKKVALISTDGQKPMYRLLFPTKKSAAGHSLGRLLSLAALTEADIFDNAHIIADNVLMFSYAEGESCLTYPEITGINLRNFYEQLSKLVDYIVVDTSTARNDIDTFFMSQSTDLCITTADTKGLAYRQFYQPQGTQLLLCSSRYNALTDILGTFQAPLKVLPYCRVLTAIYNGTDISDVKPSIRYRKTLENVVNKFVAAL